MGTLVTSIDSLFFIASLETGSVGIIASVEVICLPSNAHSPHVLRSLISLRTCTLYLMIKASTTVKITKPAIAASLDTIINHPATKDPAAKFNTSVIRRSISERANGTKPMKLYRVSRGWFFI
jgi:hypothetical protein